MKKIAERVFQVPTGSPDEDFEQLVGAFGEELRNLRLYMELADSFSPGDQNVSSAISVVEDFARDVRDSGISHVLEDISKKSYAAQDKRDALNSLLTAIESSFDGQIDFANLNYDTLLLAALTDLFDAYLSDMGDGREMRMMALRDGGAEKKCLGLRTEPELMPGRRIGLVHLHGSLVYWRDVHTGQSFKIPVEATRESAQWNAVRNKTTPLRPTIVLSSARDKAHEILQHPYSVAYEYTENSLRKSKHWMIIGYSFRDEPVNEILAKCFESHGESKPQVMVVGSKTSPTLEAILAGLRWNVEDDRFVNWLTIDREGVAGVEKRSSWDTFSARAD